MWIIPMMIPMIRFISTEYLRVVLIIRICSHTKKKKKKSITEKGLPHKVITKIPRPVCEKCNQFVWCVTHNSQRETWLLNMTNWIYFNFKRNPYFEFQMNLNHVFINQCTNEFLFSFSFYCRRCTIKGINSVVALSSGHFTKCNHCDSVCDAIQITFAAGSLQIGEIGTANHFTESKFYGPVTGVGTKFASGWPIGRPTASIRIK